MRGRGPAVGPAAGPSEHPQRLEKVAAVQPRTGTGACSVWAVSEPLMARTRFGQAAANAPDETADAAQ